MKRMDMYANENLMLAFALGGHEALVINDLHESLGSVIVALDHHKILDVVFHGTAIQLQSININQWLNHERIGRKAKQGFDHENYTKAPQTMT